MSLILRECVIERGAFRLSATLEAPASGLTVVFGPSGAGKSLLLSAIAGLVRLASGRVELNGAPVEDRGARLHIPPHARDISMVFQDARLFPHLSVRGNLDYAARRVPAGRERPDIDRLAARLDLTDLLDRGTRDLSGGEKSRVALARALASAPRLLLLDEPFAALDGRRRRQYLSLVREMSHEQSAPMLVVTHLVEDAAYMADHVVALRRGEVVAHGPAGAVMNAPAFAALLDDQDTGVRIDTHHMQAGRPMGSGVWARADNVLLARQEPQGLSARNVWPGLVEAVEEETSGSMLVRLRTDAGPVLARISREAREELDLKPSMPAFAVLKMHSV